MAPSVLKGNHMPNPQDDNTPRSLESLLDAAGKTVQPTSRGWQSLSTRLAQTPQVHGMSLGRWGTLPIGVAAVAALLLVVLWSMHRQPLQAQELPIEVQRQSVDLTVLSAAASDQETLYMPVVARQRSASNHQSQGQALVKDRRLVLHLKSGDNLVKFTDIAATIDPTSVRFESLTDPQGTTVVEQSFEYDLATADALLKRFIDREIVCVDRAGQEVAGYLASYDGATIVLSSAPAAVERTTQEVSRGSLQALRLPEMPADLISRPTLVWKLRTTTPGKHETMLSYICGFVKWHANYVIEVMPGEPGQPDLIDVDGWVTLENTSGSTYPHAGLRLIAGDVRRLQDPWQRTLDEENKARFGKRKHIIYSAADLATLRDLMNEGRYEVVPSFAEQSLFEYHLYVLNTPCTVADHELKQLALLTKKGAKAKRRYLFDPRDANRSLAIELLVKNEEENKLGLPLPKGAVTLQQRGLDGELAVVGKTEIDHTAVKEELKLRYGHAFDVIGEHRQVQVERINKESRITYETRIRNHKPVPVDVRCYGERLPAGAILRQASLRHVVENSSTIYFDFTLPANAEQVIRYTVVYRSEK
jgi:hypothetical protein